MYNRAERFKKKLAADAESVWRPGEEFWVRVPEIVQNINELKQLEVEAKQEPYPVLTGKTMGDMFEYMANRIAHTVKHQQINVDQLLTHALPYGDQKVVITMIWNSPEVLLDLREKWDEVAETVRQQMYFSTSFLTRTISTILANIREWLASLEDLKVGASQQEKLDQEEHAGLQNNNLMLAALLNRPVIIDKIIKDVLHADVHHLFTHNWVPPDYLARLKNQIDWAVGPSIKGYIDKFKMEAKEVQSEFAETLQPTIEKHVDGSKFAKFLEQNIKYVFGPGLEKDMAIMIKKMVADGLQHDLSIGSKLYNFIVHGLEQQLSQVPVEWLRWPDAHNRAWEVGTEKEGNHPYDLYLDGLMKSYRNVLEREKDHVIGEMVERHGQDKMHAGLATMWFPNMAMSKSITRLKDFVDEHVVQAPHATDLDFADVQVEEFASPYFDFKQSMVDGKKYRVFSSIANNRAYHKIRLRELPKQFATMVDTAQEDILKLEEENKKKEVKNLPPAATQYDLDNLSRRIGEIKQLPLPEIGQYAEKYTQNQARKAALDLEYPSVIPDISWAIYKLLMTEVGITHTLGIHYMDTPIPAENLSRFLELNLGNDSYTVTEEDDAKTRMDKAKQLVEDIAALINHEGPLQESRSRYEVSMIYSYVLPRLRGISSFTKLKVADELYPLVHSHFGGFNHNNKNKQWRQVTDYLQAMIDNPNVRRMPDNRAIRELMGLYTEITFLKKEQNILKRREPDEYGEYYDYDDEEYDERWEGAYYGATVTEEEKEAEDRRLRRMEEIDGDTWHRDRTEEEQKEYRILFETQDAFREQMKERGKREKEEFLKKEKEEWGFDGVLGKLKVQGLIDDRHLQAVNQIEELVNKQKKLPLDKSSLDALFQTVRFAQVAVKATSQYAGLAEYTEKAEKKLPEVTSAPNWEVPERQFRFRVLQDQDPQHFTIGAETNCCQILGGVGEAAAVDSYINQYAGVLLVEFLIKGEWKVAMQSYFHYVPEHKSYILDNVEHDAQVSDRSSRITGMEPEQLYALWAEEMKKRYPEIQYIGVGKSYTVIDLKGFGELKGLEEDPREFHDDLGEPYTDFYYGDAADLLSPTFDTRQETKINLEDLQEDAAVTEAPVQETRDEQWHVLRSHVIGLWRKWREKTYKLPSEKSGTITRDDVQGLKGMLIALGSLKGMDVEGWEDKSLNWIEKRLFGKRAFLQGLLVVTGDWLQVNGIIRKARAERKYANLTA